jgi:hypothetical protein
VKLGVVLRFIDNAHNPIAEIFDDEVVRDGFVTIVGRDWHNLRFHPQSSQRVERLCGKIDSIATKCLRRLVIPTHRRHCREMWSRKLLKIGKNWRMSL